MICEKCKEKEATKRLIFTDQKEIVVCPNHKEEVIELKTKKNYIGMRDLRGDRRVNSTCKK